MKRKAKISWNATGAIPAHGTTDSGVPVQFHDPPLADGLGLRELGEVTLDVSGTEMRRVFKGCEK